MKKALILAIAGLMVFGFALAATADYQEFFYNPSDITIV